MTSTNLLRFAKALSIPALCLPTVLAGAASRPALRHLPVAASPVFVQSQKLTIPSGDPYAAAFGNAVAVDGQTAVVGAPDDSYGSGFLQGRAYVFSYGDGVWTEVAELTAGDAGNADYFGTAVAISGDTIMVGAPLHNSATGAIYVFSDAGGTWTQVAELTAGDAAANAYFGWSVALDGSTALVGSPLAAAAGTTAQGQAYVFTGSGANWTQAAEFTAADGEANGWFGYSVALAGPTALVGELYATVGANVEQGAAYVFGENQGNWNQVQKLTAGAGQAYDLFGDAVALSGTTGLIGAPAVNTGRPGSAYVFAESGGSWSETQALDANGAAAADEFGRALALDGARALIGAPNRSVGGNTAQGAAYVFDAAGGTWSQSAMLTASDGAQNDLFGDAAALQGDTLFVGASAAAAGGVAAQGAVYSFAANDLALALSAPATVDPGANYTSQAILTNNAATYSAPMAVTMTVPAGTGFVSADASQGSCSENSGVVACSFGQVAGNGGTATADLTLDATGNAGATIENTASLSGTLPPLNAAAQTVINGGNTPPVADDGALTTDENTAASGTLTATDANGDPLTFTIVAEPQHGSVTLDDAATGAYTYTPDQGYSGSDGFTFKANDGQADSNIATVSITVNASGGGGGGGSSGGSSGGGGATAPFMLLALAGLAALIRRRS